MRLQLALGLDKHIPFLTNPVGVTKTAATVFHSMKTEQVPSLAVVVFRVFVLGLTTWKHGIPLGKHNYFEFTILPIPAMTLMEKY